jgi:ribosomal protein S21
MVEVKKKDNETSEGLIRRFTRAMQQSKILPKVRKQRFHTKKKNKGRVKKDAIYRVKVGKEADKLKRMGIFTDDKLRDIKKNIEV